MFLLSDRTERGHTTKMNLSVSPPFYGRKDGTPNKVRERLQTESNVCICYRDYGPSRTPKVAVVSLCAFKVTS